MAESLLISLDELVGPEELVVDELVLEQEPTEQPTERSGVISLSQEQKIRLLRQVRAHYDEAITARNEDIDRAEERLQRYYGDTDLRAGMQPWDDAPQIFVPETRKTVETLKDEFTEALGGVDAVMMRGIGEEDVSVGEIKTRFIRHGLSDINPIHFEELIDWAVHDALIDSLAVFKVYPYTYPFDAPFPEAEALQNIIRIDVVDQRTLLIPPNAEGLQWPECSYIGQQLWVSIDEFASMKNRGFDVPSAEMVLANSSLDDRQYTDDERKLLEFTRMGWEPDEASGEFDPRLEMVESYELFDINEGDEREFIIISWFPNLRSDEGASPGSGGQIARVIRLSDALPQRTFPRPMWPFFPLTVWQQPRQLRGLNVPDRLESSQDLLNRLAEQMIQQGEIDILPYVFANVALAGDLPNLSRIKPGDIVPLDNLGSVTFSPRQSSNRHYQELMQMPRTWAEEDTGVTAFTQGRSQEQPNAPRTLGGLSLMLQQSNKGFKKQVKHLSRQLQKMLRFYAGLWQHRAPDSIDIPMPDTEGLEERLFGGGPIDQQAMVTVSRDEHLSGLLDIRIRANPDAFMEQQKKLALVEKLDELLAPIWPLGRREMWKDLWESLGLQEFDQFYPEQVATIQTMILVMNAQLQLAVLEGKMQQVGMANQAGPLAGLLPQGNQGQDAGVGRQPAPVQQTAQQGNPLAGLLNASPAGLAA